MSDAINAPSHYRGRSGLQSIEVTHAWRLGPDLTQAVDYILRAGRKTPDPRQDLAKAVFYLRYAQKQPDAYLTFGAPRDNRPTVATVVDDFGLDPLRAVALAAILVPYPTDADCERAAVYVERAIEWYVRQSLPAAQSWSAAI